MVASTAPWPIPQPPPGELDLPYDDGEPMDTPRHRQQMNLLITSLELAWQARDDFFVGGNMFVYFSDSQTVRNDFRGPDVFVVLDTERRERRSWVIWAEGGRAPTVVIELTSPSTEDVDRGAKMEIYARRMRVPIYVLFDPWTGKLEGYELDSIRLAYRPLEALPNGNLSCAPLGLSLGVRPGVHERVEAPWLRWIGEDGKILPSEHEVAEEERKKAEREREEAQQQRCRADEEARRADALVARMAEYEKRFGVLG